MSEHAVSPRALWVVVALAFALGTWLRLDAASRFLVEGQEAIHSARYVAALSKSGWGGYPELVTQFVEARRAEATPPSPLCVLWLWPAAVVHEFMSVSPGASLNAISVACSVLLMAASFFLARRLIGLMGGAICLGWVAVAPTQLMFCDVATSLPVLSLCVGTALCGLLLLDRSGWRKFVVGGSTMGLMLCGPESYVALAALVMVAAWNRPSLDQDFAAIVCGCVAGVAVMVSMCGGLGEYGSAYSAILYPPPSLTASGQGPFHRYLYDLTIAGPLVVFLLIGSAVRMPGLRSWQGMLWAFLIVAYVGLATAPMGMNLRYANFLDVPLRLLGTFALMDVLAASRWRPLLLQTAAASVVFVSEFSLYQRIVLERGVRNPTTPNLLKAVDILK